MIYQLELRQHGIWNRIRSSSDLSYVQKFKDAVFDRAHHNGWRIFDADRKRLKSGELAGGPTASNNRRAPGVRSVADLAKDAAEHIKKTGQKTILVFPLGKTGSNVSNQFRKHLFGHITGRVAQWWTDADRVKSEAIATKEMGYTIIEIDPEIYA